MIIPTEELRKIVYGFDTKYEEGFTDNDLKKLLSKYFPKITIKQLNEKIGRVTCVVINNEEVIYHCDVDLAIRCIIEDREFHPREWD